MTSAIKKNRADIFIHISIWIILIFLPVVFEMRNGSFYWANFVSFLPFPLALMIVFYTDFSLLTNNFLFKKKTLLFVIINLILVVGLALALHFWHEAELSLGIPKKLPPAGTQQVPVRVFIFRDIFTLAFVAVVSTIIKMTMRLNTMQTKQQSLEKAMTEAELKNLKNQINPHFLLNTLNNIYALSQFNSPKTSDAILELSKLLRYVLYHNETTYVPLAKEVDFIKSYIELMQLRTAENVKVTSKFEINETNNTLIAPLIYISLIENAFKHGISNNKPSFIDIELIEKNDGVVEFYCKNSLFPKNKTDKSGSGIGLSQVIKRLKLIYPGRHKFSTEISADFYLVKLVIETKED